MYSADLRLILISIAIFGSTIITAQTVENIVVETVDEAILIHYRIGNSKESQIYNVTLTCSMDGRIRFEPKSVSGDVGKNILGGKSRYTITWDVFKDVEEVGNAQFYVKVDHVDNTSGPGEEDPLGKSSSTEELFERSTFIGFNGSTYSPFGLGAGSLKKSGFFASVRAGTNNDEFQTDYWFTLTAGFTRHLLSRDTYRLHAYGGLGTSVEHYEDLELNSSWTSPMLAMELGVMNVIGRISVTLGTTYVNGYGIHLVYGVGFLF